MEVKEQYYFIVNRKSKTGKAAEIWRELEQVLKERKVPYHAYTTKYYRHATELADQICSKPGKINLVVVGGGCAVTSLHGERATNTSAAGGPGQPTATIRHWTGWPPVPPGRRSSVAWGCRAEYGCLWTGQGNGRGTP